MSPQITCPRECKVTLVASVWFFSTVCFQMSTQITCPRGCIITLVAFLCLFSTVHFQICPQIVCLKGFIITLAAFVRLFPNMCFQMSTQRSWIRASKLTLVAFFLLFASVRLRINPQMACMRRCIVLVKHWIPMLSISSERQRFYQSVRDLKQGSAISSWASEILRSVRDMYSRKKRAAKKLSLQSARTGIWKPLLLKPIPKFECLDAKQK